MGRSDTPDPGELRFTQAGDIAEDQAEYLRIASVTASALSEHETLRAPAKARGEPIGDGIRGMSEPTAETVGSALVKRMCWPTQ